MGQLSLCYSSSITLIFRMCPNKGRVTIKTYNIIKIRERNNFNFTLDSMVINYFFTLSMAFPQPNILSGNRSSLLIDEYNFKAPSRSLLSPTLLPIIYIQDQESYFFAISSKRKNVFGK